MKKVKYYIVYFAFASFAIFGLNSCESTTGSGINLYSPSDDVEMGRQLDGEIRKNSGDYPIYNNQVAQNYLQDIVNQIIQSDEIKYRGVFDYKVAILNSSTINAFVTPGGYVYVYRGLLNFLDNEATLAFILAHEVAHAERRHATQRMTKQLGMSVLLSVVLGNNPSQLAEIAGNLLTGLELLRNSREDEYEADEYAFKYLLSTKWYPGAGIMFFDQISQGSSGNDFTELFSTHPLDNKRKAALNDLIKKHNIGAPTEANIFSQKYQQFKATIQ